MNPHNVSEMIRCQIQIANKRSEASRHDRVGAASRTRTRAGERDEPEQPRPQRPRLGVNGPLVHSNINRIVIKPKETRHDSAVSLSEKSSKPPVVRSKKEMVDIADMLTNGGCIMNASMEKNVVSGLDCHLPV